MLEYKADACVTPSVCEGREREGVLKIGKSEIAECDQNVRHVQGWNLLDQKKNPKKEEHVENKKQITAQSVM